jgi:hypothetical protein
LAYRKRERVTEILSFRESDRVPFDVAGSGGEQFADLVASMKLSDEHRQFCLEGDFEYVAFNPIEEPDRFLPYLAGLPADGHVTE